MVNKYKTGVWLLLCIKCFVILLLFLVILVLLCCCFFVFLCYFVLYNLTLVVNKLLMRICSVKRVDITSLSFSQHLFSLYFLFSFGFTFNLMPCYIFFIRSIPFGITTDINYYYCVVKKRLVCTFWVYCISAVRNTMTFRALFESVCCWVTAVSTSTILKPQPWHCDTTVSQSWPSIHPAEKPPLFPWLAVDHVYSAVSSYFIYCCRELVSLVTGAVVSALLRPIKLLLHCVSEWDSYSSWSHNIKTRCEHCVLSVVFGLSS